MERRPVVWFVAVSLLSLCASCSPTLPAVRPTPSDSGRSLDAIEIDSACADAERPSVEDAARTDAHDDRAPDFRLVLLDPPISVARGETAPLHVRIDRVGGFEAPVLIDLWGLPDTLWAQARESRAGDGVVEITVEASEDAEVVEATPFAVQASALGIRRVERTTISVR
jgi:hypothetical protein